MRKKRMTAILLAGAMVLSTLAGCGSKETAAPEAPASEQAAEKSTAETGETPAAEKKDDAEVVELSFYMSNGPVIDQERIMEKANAIIEEEINAHLNLILVDGATYADKMNLMINSGDAWDLCFTASWGGINFFENAAKGAYADLTDLIPVYAPETYARIPEGLWDGVKVNGRIYGLVNYQQWGVASRKGFKFRSDIVDELGFDWKAVKGKPTLEVLEMMGPFLGEALEAHPDMIGFETSSGYSLFANEPLMCGIWKM